MIEKNSVEKFNQKLSSLERFRESFELNNYIIQPQIMHINYVRCQHKKRLAPRFHSHRTYELSIILSGKVKYVFKQYEVTVATGDFVIIPPDSNHYIDLIEDSTIANIMLFISHPGDGAISEIAKLHQSIELCNCHIPAFNEYEAIIQTIIAEATGMLCGWEENIQCLTRQLYIIVFRRLMPGVKSVAHTRNLPPQRGDTIQSIVELVRYYLQDNIHRKLEVREICSHIGVSQTYLNLIFHKTCGTNVSKYVTDYKIGTAKRLLLNSDRSLKDISCSIGYEDIAHFCRVFKKLTGTTPSEFRRNI